MLTARMIFTDAFIAQPTRTAQTRLTMRWALQMQRGVRKVMSTPWQLHQNDAAETNRSRMFGEHT
jgi:hypothetical protein